MPRGGGRRSAPAMSRPAPSRQPPPPPARAAAPPATHAPPPPVSQGPGLMGQMMATAGGVAIGSAVGHTIGNMMSGGGSHDSAEAQPAQQSPPSQPYNYQQQQPMQKPCEFELDQFLNCTKNSDLSMCEGFNQVLKECRSRYGM